MKKPSFCDPEQVEEHAQMKLQERRRIKEEELRSSNVNSTEKHESLSTLIFYMVKPEHLQLMLPDYELTHCKEIFKATDCHESHFGMARLLCFEGEFRKALEMVESALKNRSDLLYKRWECALQVKNYREVESDTMQMRSFFQSFFCCAVVRSQSPVLALLENLPNDGETLWNYMELSMKRSEGLEMPEFYAGKIKEFNSFLGYLAWSEVYFRRNEWQNGVNILKQLIMSYPHHPEPYVKLWYHYYYHVQDFEQAQDTISEALLMLTSPDHHNFYILFCIFSGKTLFKLKQTSKCIDFLHKKFLEYPTYPMFLYHYARYCTKSEDYIYNGSAIGALHECIRLCDPSKHGQIYYWLSKAYMLGRQHLDAYDTVKLALSTLPSKYTRKMAELKRWILDMQPSVEKLEAAEAILSSDLNEANYKQFREICTDVKDLHKLAVDVLYAKMLWKTGRYEEALKKLYAVSGISTVKMTAHFLLLKFLEEQKNLICMKTVAYEMVAKCKNPQVPTHVWVKANLLYSKILLKNNKPGKAILILKCMAKVLPPMPFIDIPYTKLLRRAQNLQELASAFAKDYESCNAYIYSNYKNSFVGDVEVREFSYRLVGEEAAPLPGNVQRRFKERRSERVPTGGFDVRTYTKKKSIEEKEKEKEKNVILGVAIPDLSEFNSLSVCSDPTFLFKIAKIAINHNICMEDGICAIKDYVELLKFERDKKKREKMMVKAMKIRCALCQAIKNQ